MHHKNIMSLALFGALIGAAQTGSAATLDEYVGRYDMVYTAAGADLTVSVSTPYAAYQFPLHVDVVLEDGQIPYSYAEDFVVTATAVLDDYATNLPPQAQARLTQALELAVYKAIDQINAAALALPDLMDLTIVNSRTNSVQGLFTDPDGLSSQFAMVGTLIPGTGEFAFLSIYAGQLEEVQPEVWAGKGTWGISDINASQTVRYSTVNVSGSAVLFTDLFGQ